MNNWLVSRIPPEANDTKAPVSTANTGRTRTAKHSISILLLVLFITSASQAQELLNDINTSVAVDIVAPVSLEESSNNKLNVRSAEVLFYGPLDPIFDGTLNIAGHNEEGEFNFELHEAYFGSSKLIPQSRFRVGKFFLNVGRLNGSHQHDWPFVTAPKVHREFFSPGAESFEAEGAEDTGIECSWLLPTKHFFDVTIGLTNGYCYGHCHDEGERPRYPLHYIHPTTFFSFGTTKGLLVGATYLGRMDGSEIETKLYGLEATYKNRIGKILRWFVQSEIFYQTQSAPNVDTAKKAGFYVFSQYGLDPRWSLGVRLDGFSHLNMKFESNNEDRNDFDYAVVPTLTYKSSEFSTVRLAYSHEVDTTQGIGDVLDRQLQLQVTLLLGAHPAHDF